MKRLKISFWLLLSICLLILLSCGGGTTGTGDIRQPRIEGQLRDSLGMGVAGAQVTVLQSGDQATTDEEGKFQIETSFFERNLDLLLNKDDFERSVPIGDLPAGNTLVQVSLELDLQEGLVNVVALQIEPISEQADEDSGDDNQEPIADSPNEGSQDQDESSNDDTPVATKGFSIFRGKVVFRDGSPVAGAEIIIIDTNKQAVTNSAGRFSLRIKSKGGNLSLVVRYGESSGSALIQNIPRKDVVIEVTLQINLDPPQPGQDLPGPGTLPLTLGATSIS